MNTYVERIKALEAKYCQNGYHGYLSGPATLSKVSPSSNVLLVAKHSVMHWDKDGASKLADLYTGALVEYLHEKTGCSFISSIRTHDDISPFMGETSHDRLIRELSAQKPLVVLDIHGMKKNEFSIAIGYGNLMTKEQELMMDNISDIFPANEVAFNPSGYSARAKHSTVEITKSIGNPAVLQIELSRNLRKGENDDFIAKMKEFIICCEGMYG